MISVSSQAAGEGAEPQDEQDVDDEVEVSCDDSFGPADLGGRAASARAQLTPDHSRKQDERAPSPVQAYVDPNERVTQSRAAAKAGDVKTWSVTVSPTRPESSITTESDI